LHIISEHHWLNVTKFILNQRSAIKLTYTFSKD